MKRRIGGNPLTCIALIAALLVTTSPVLAADLNGQASVIDGDTIEIHGTRVRLWGIDAPESSQLCRGEDSLQYRCGAKAANDLDVFIARAWSFQIVGMIGQHNLTDFPFYRLRYFGAAPSSGSTIQLAGSTASETPARSSARLICAAISGFTILVWVSGSMWPASGR